MKTPLAIATILTLGTAAALSGGAQGELMEAHGEEKVGGE